MDTHEQTITITEIPETRTPTRFAHAGECMGLEANGEEGNPSAKAWGRAGVAAGMILRYQIDGQLSLAMLVAIIAQNSDPALDDSTPERTQLITNHASVAQRCAESRIGQTGEAPMPSTPTPTIEEADGLKLNPHLSDGEVDALTRIMAGGT